jgi:HAD superfamily hydrolase (TIGR01450 family)
MTTELIKLSLIKHVALDMDGTIYKGSTLFPFTLPFLESLRGLGIGHSFLTNNSSKSVKDYVKSLSRLGVPALETEVVTSGLATIEILRTELPELRQLFVLGTESLQTEFRENGFEVVSAAAEPDAVVVGFDTSLCFENLCAAAYWISNGKPYIATHPDKICPTDQPTVLVDCGALVSCLESATGRLPDLIVGKPEPRMLRAVMSRYNVEASQVAMVGDRLYTDILMAANAGAFGVLVLSGEATQADADTFSPAPDLIVSSIKEFGELLAQSRQGAKV